MKYIEEKGEEQYEANIRSKSIIERKPSILT